MVVANELPRPPIAHNFRKAIVVESSSSILNGIIKYKHSYVAVRVLLCLTLA